MGLYSRASTDASETMATSMSEPKPKKPKRPLVVTIDAKTQKVKLSRVVRLSATEVELQSDD